MGTRITIDSLTCLLANESDPSRLIASSPGKLTRYLLPDGSHVQNDQPYAEVEVRQLCITASARFACYAHSACMPCGYAMLCMLCRPAILDAVRTSAMLNLCTLLADSPRMRSVVKCWSRVLRHYIFLVQQQMVSALCATGHEDDDASVELCCWASALLHVRVVSHEPR